ncbi:MAG: hypothetical protein PVH19_09105, partial [Planctomycetia bacterium]
MKKRAMLAATIVAACTLLAAMPTTSLADLSIDFNDRSYPDFTQTDFDAFVIDDEVSTPVTRTFGTNDVTLYMVGPDIYKDRYRSAPLNDGAFTEENLLRDFVFANDTAGGGLNVRVDGLTPNGIYTGSIWCFDDVSSGVRMSDWIANGTVVANNYVYDGADVTAGNGTPENPPVSPPSNDTYRIDFTATASANGVLMIQGRHEKLSDGVSVMLNGLQLTDTGTTLQKAATPVLSADFGAGSAMSGFTQVNLATATTGATVGGKTVTVAPAGQFSEIATATSYEVFVNFWSDDADDWAIRARLSNAFLLLDYDVTNSVNTGITSSNRTLYTASLGTLTPAELATISVIWDDIDQSSTYERTWFDSFTLKRTDDDALFHIAATDENTVGTASPEDPWNTTETSEPGGLWRYRSGYAEYADGIYQATRSLGDHLELSTTFDDPAPGTPTTPVTLTEGDTGTVTGGVDFTQSDLLADYIVASNGDIDTSGLDVLIEDLTPGEEYSLTLWAFDDSATESTRSTWTANGVLVNDDYRFDADQDPMTNLEYSFSFLTIADENGEILIEGRVGSEGLEGLVTKGNVYLNALEIYELAGEDLPGDAN